MVISKRHLTARINSILQDYQFSRSRISWNREWPEFVDIIDTQFNKFGDAFTVNVGIADRFVVYTCWGINDPRFIDESMCTVRARLGELLYGRDVWWSLSDEDEVEEALSSIQRLAIPFLEFNHQINHMIEFLENDSASIRYPPGVIYLAILYHRNGQSDRCREVFNSIKLTGAWSEKLSSIIDALN